MSIAGHDHMRYNHGRDRNRGSPVCNREAVVVLREADMVMIVCEVVMVMTRGRTVVVVKWDTQNKTKRYEYKCTLFSIYVDYQRNEF